MNPSGSEFLHTLHLDISNVTTVARTGGDPPPPVDGPTQPEPEPSKHNAAPVGRRLASTLSIISPIVLCLLIC